MTIRSNKWVEINYKKMYFFIWSEFIMIIASHYVLFTSVDLALSEDSDQLVLFVSLLQSMSRFDSRNSAKKNQLKTPTAFLAFRWFFMA